jgi:hypothetical protein
MRSRIQAEQEISWIYHPILGVYTERGYMRHREIFERQPNLRRLDTPTGELDYDPPRGFALVKPMKSQVIYSRYDQSRFALPGTNDPADALEVDTAVRKSYQIPSNFTSMLLGCAKWWI